MSSDPRDTYTRTVEPEVITEPAGSNKHNTKFQDFLNRMKDPGKRKPFPLVLLLIVMPLVLGLFIVLFFIGLGGLILARIIISMKKLFGGTKG